MQARPHHILVADDDDDDQFIIKEAISEFTATQIVVTPVYDGVQLLDYLNRKSFFTVEGLNRPDLILLDIDMPVMTGVETLAQLKSDPAFRDIPVFMISTTGCEKHYTKCRELGALNLYAKPNNVSDYRNMMEQILRQSIYREAV